MKKRLLFLFFICSVFVQAQQENSIKVQRVLSPSSDVKYNSVDSSDFVIQILNLGPNTLVRGDRFHIVYSVGDGTANSQDYDTLLLVGGAQSMQVNEVRTYTINDNVKFSGNGDFAATADVVRTDVYPINSNKDSKASSLFAVNIKKLEKLNFNKVYYADGTITFSLNTAQSFTVEVYDITGKTILRKNLKNNKEHKLNFNSTQKGFYFIKAIAENGNSSVAKFVIH